MYEDFLLKAIFTKVFFGRNRQNSILASVEKNLYFYSINCFLLFANS